MNKYADSHQMYIPLTGIPPLRNTHKENIHPPQDYNPELQNPNRKSFFTSMYDYFETCINNACERFDDLINKDKSSKVYYNFYPSPIIKPN